MRFKKLCVLLISSIFVLLLLNCSNKKQFEAKDFSEKNLDDKYGLTDFELTTSVEPSFHTGFIIKIQSKKGKNVLKIFPDVIGEYYFGTFKELIIPIPDNKIAEFLNQIKSMDLSSLEVFDECQVDGIRGFAQIAYNNSIAKEFVWVGDYYEVEDHFLKTVFDFTKQFVYHNPHLGLIENAFASFSFMPGYSIYDQEPNYVSIFNGNQIDSLKIKLEKFDCNAPIIFNFSNFRNEDFINNDVSILKDILGRFKNSWYLVEGHEIKFIDNKSQEEYPYENHSLKQSYDKSSSYPKDILYSMGILPQRIFSNISQLTMRLEAGRWKTRWAMSMRTGSPVPVPDAE